MIVALPRCTARKAVTVNGSDDGPGLQRCTGARTDRSDDDGFCHGNPGPSRPSVSMSSTYTVAPTGTCSVVQVIRTRSFGSDVGSFTHAACAEVPQAATPTAVITNSSPTFRRQARPIIGGRHVGRRISKARAFSFLETTPDDANNHAGGSWVDRNSAGRSAAGRSRVRQLAPSASDGSRACC
jgi:hypothetical protein